MALAVSLISNAQIKEGNQSMSQGSNNALTIELIGTDAKNVSKSFEGFLKKYKGKTKFDKKTGEMFSDNALITELNGNNTTDVYAKFSQSGTNVIMTVWFDLGGAYLSSQMHAQQYPAAEKMLYAFAITVSRGLVEEELKKEQKKQKELEDQHKDLVKDQKNFEKDIENLKKDIENYKRKIAEAEQNIETTKNKIQETVKAQGSKMTEVDGQKEVVKAVEKKLKDLE